MRKKLLALVLKMLGLHVYEMRLSTCGEGEDQVLHLVALKEPMRRT